MRFLYHSSVLNTFSVPVRQNVFRGALSDWTADEGRGVHLFIENNLIPLKFDEHRLKGLMETVTGQSGRQWLIY